MTAIAPVRVPTPRLKSAATSGASSESAAASHPKSETSDRLGRDGASLPPARVAHRAARAPSTDFLSDKATSAFIRRVLCSQHLAEKGKTTLVPIEELLPPLSSRNDVDLQLYALIAVVLREFVQAWYSKITSDEAFVGEIVQIIAHCTRALEQRLRKVDLESLLFDELPDLLERHISAYRIAHDPMARPPTEVDPREVYHSLCPLAPMSPVPKPEDSQSTIQQQENEGAYRQLLAHGVLAILLPTEDLENDCLTSLVGQIFSELIIGNMIANKLSQPWLIWEGLCILVRVVGRKEPDTIDESVADALDQTRPTSFLPKQDHRRWSIQGIFWALIQWSFLAFTSLRILISTLAMSSSLPWRRKGRRRSIGEKANMTSHNSRVDVTNPVTAPATTNEPEKVPIVTFRLWSAISSLIELESRMPWLSGALSMMQLAAMNGPGQIAGLDGILDRHLSYTIQRRVLDASHLPPLLRTIRGAIFPNNSLGAPTMVAPSSDEELLALRRRCASAVWGLLPRWMSRLYFGGHGLGRWRSGPAATGSPGNQHDGQGQRPEQSPDLSREQPDSAARAVPVGAGAGGRSDGMADSDLDAEDARVISEIDQRILDVFSDEYCNKHLMYSALELILVRLMPELAEKTVTELLEERLG